MPVVLKSSQPIPQLWINCVGVQCMKTVPQASYVWSAHQCHHQWIWLVHYSDAEWASPIILIVCSTVCSGADQRKHQSAASLDFVRGIHRWPVDSPHKGPVTRKIVPFDDVIMQCWVLKKSSCRCSSCIFYHYFYGNYHISCSNHFNIP